MEKLEQNDNVNRDELIMQQQREIEKEISETIPLVSEKLPVACLNDEYLGDAVFTSKILDLAGKYSFMRRTRPDGNCFFRAFAYAYLEHLISNKDDYEKFRHLAETSKDKLVELGFPRLTLEDFHETFMEVVRKVDPNATSEGDMGTQLHNVFNDQGYSDYVVVYLRLLTSGKLEEEADFYQNFIEGNYTIEEFRHQEVEPMYKESDHIHIIALCSALGVGVRVEYMDRGEGGLVKAHDFPEGQTPKVFLIYRPGHYDILYPK
uniref:ubiquitinyl hydrolase 1 n=1 Tax=Glossina brevipalpis TaxID=37001 RepID=A0A1A9W5B6_9MUSC